jgi:Na+/H+ antiporter
MHAVATFELVIAMMLAIIALHYAAHRLSLPPAVALLTGGSLLAFLPGLPVVALDPELVLVIFLPPLLMDGAWFTALSPFRRHLSGIVALAVGAVLFTTVVIAIVTHLLIPSLPWAACAALGAIVSPPDAVSARAVLQRVHLPSRLTALLEGESLLNDAAGLVLFRFAVAATITGTFNAGDALLSFAVLALGGAAVGVAIGALWVLLVRRLQDEYLVIATSVLVCWTAYLAAEMLHVSGVIATVVMGLICGWYQHVLFSASIRMRGTSFWMVMVFLLEASVFILIGFSLRGVIERVGGFALVLDQMAVPALLIVLAVIASRFVWVFASDVVLLLCNRLGWTTRRPLRARAGTVLSWAGMRGVVTLAVALTLPEAMPGRDFMLVTAFAIILVTVLVQGMTLGAVIRKLDVREAEGAGPKLNLLEAEAQVAQAQLDAVERLAYDEDGTLRHPRLLETYTRRASISANYHERSEEMAPGMKAHFNVIVAAIAAGRTELVRLHRAAEIDDETLHSLERDLDLEELHAISVMS